jgi:hypothetical protein
MTTQTSNIEAQPVLSALGSGLISLYRAIGRKF